MEFKQEFGKIPVHDRIFEIKSKDSNKQDIEKSTDIIQIVYEMGRVKKELNNNKLYQEVELLLEKADSILKKYIRV